MIKCNGRLWAAAIVVGLAVAAPAAADVVKTSFGVSATVVAACRIHPGQASVCAPTQAQASVIPAKPPVVTYSRDPKTGAIIQIIEF